MRISYNKQNIILGALLIVGLGIVLVLALLVAKYNFFLGVGVAVFMAILVKQVYIPIVRNFWKGEAGEEKAHNFLANLPNTFYRLHDVVLGKTGNIDEVVISPKGIWTIEVKNIKDGEITFKNEVLCRNGYPLAGKNLKEAYHEARELQDFIRKTLNLYVPVSPVIVFANPRNKVRFGFEGINGVQVIGINWLVKLLLNHNLVVRLTQDQCLVVKNELKKYTSTF